MKVLLLGVSGYLGQFIFQKFYQKEGIEVYGTYLSHPLPNIPSNVQFKLDFQDFQNISQILDSIGPDLNVVINTVAISNIKQVNLLRINAKSNLCFRMKIILQLPQKLIFQNVSFRFWH
jgi:dTDP-4-dehydrorhamnose reductase